MCPQISNRTQPPKSVGCGTNRCAPKRAPCARGWWRTLTIRKCLKKDRGGCSMIKMNASGAVRPMLLLMLTGASVSALAQEAPATPAPAETVADNGTDIVVTAQKRAEIGRAHV